jgi:hypothetical protein
MSVRTINVMTDWLTDKVRGIKGEVSSGGADVDCKVCREGC